MIKLQEVLKLLDFNEKDRENVKKLIPVIKEYGNEIADETINTLSKSPEIAKEVTEVVQKSNISISEIKDRWVNEAETALSLEFNEEYEKKIRDYSKSLIKMGIVDPDFVAIATFLFLIKTLNKLSSLGLDNSKDLSNTATKVVLLFLVERIGSYNEQLINSFLKFTGMSRKLFERQITLQGKEDSKEKA